MNQEMHGEFEQRTRRLGTIDRVAGFGSNGDQGDAPINR